VVYNEPQTMASRIEARIIDMGIRMFADRGYEGVSFRDLAEEADVTVASLFRLFGNKKELFEKVLTKALEQTLDPAQFLFLIYEGGEKPDKMRLFTLTVMRWYASVSPHAARLFFQSSLQEDWRELAYSRINKIMEILGTTLQHGQSARRADKAATRTKSAVAAHAMIFGLLQLKMTYATSRNSKEEAELATSMIRRWLRPVV
jgi:AcrR family transcriptional regulator